MFNSKKAECQLNIIATFMSSVCLGPSSFLFFNFVFYILLIALLQLIKFSFRHKLKIKICYKNRLLSLLIKIFFRSFKNIRLKSGS